MSSVVIEGETIKIKMTAGAAITKGQVVYVSGAGQVSPADETNAGKVVAENNAYIPVTAGVAALTADLGHDNTTGDLQTTAASSVGVKLPEHGRIIGIALGSAAAAGDQIEIFVCKM